MSGNSKGKMNIVNEITGMKYSYDVEFINKILILRGKNKGVVEEFYYKVSDKPVLSKELIKSKAAHLVAINKIDEKLHEMGVGVVEASIGDSDRVETFGDINVGDAIYYCKSGEVEPYELIVSKVNRSVSCIRFKFMPNDLDLAEVGGIAITSTKSWPYYVSFNEAVKAIANKVNKVNKVKTFGCINIGDTIYYCKSDEAEPYGLTVSKINKCNEFYFEFEKNIFGIRTMSGFSINSTGSWPYYTSLREAVKELNEPQIK